MSKEESDFEFWAGLHFDVMYGEIWADDADGNRERAPVQVGSTR